VAGDPGRPRAGRVQDLADQVVGEPVAGAGVVLDQQAGGQGTLGPGPGPQGLDQHLGRGDRAPPGQQQLQQGPALAAGQPLGRDLTAVDSDREHTQHLHADVAVATHPPIVVDHLCR
jgi:hypothetical protein